MLFRIEVQLTKTIVFFCENIHLKKCLKKKHVGNMFLNVYEAFHVNSPSAKFLARV